MKTPLSTQPFSTNSKKENQLDQRRVRLTALFAAVALLALNPHAARGANLLVNPGFEQNSGHTIPTGWTRFAPPTAQSYGNYWVEGGGITNVDGVQHFKEWGASYNGTNNAAGIYQDLSSAPGSVYQASGWFYTSGSDTLGSDCYVWIEVLFLGSNSNLLALYKSDPFNSAVGTGNWFQYQVNNACDITQPVSIGDPYFNTYAPTGTVTQIVAPAGTTTVRYRFVYVQVASEGGSCYLDATVLNQISGPVPPVISNLYPLNMIFVPPADGISFGVSSPSGYTINNSAIGLVVNGVNVSSSLNISGSSSNKTVTYQGLASNTVYTASVTVTDVFGLSASANTYFETTWVGVPPVLYQWEAEDWDFTNGMYIDFPTLCAVDGIPNCYFDKVGVEGTDEHNLASPSPHVYRANDAMNTVISGDYARKDHYLAGVQDYRVDPFIQQMWLNYTRDWSNGTYWVIGRLSTDIGLSGSLTLSVVNPDTTTTQLGTFSINSGLGWSTFENVYLQDTNGNHALVTLNGKQTLQLTSGGNLLPNFFMLVAAQADIPLIKNMYPTGTRPFEYTNTFSFAVTTLGSTIPTGGLRVNLDGFDVTPNLVITGTPSSNNVVLPSILPNAVHLAIITVTNALGHGIAVTNNFDTFNEANYMVNLMNFDYGGGQFLDDSANPNAYFGYDAVTNVDYQHTSLSGEQYPYRTAGIPESSLNGQDYLRSNFVYTGSIDYVLAFFADGDWANYTRVYPAGTFYAYCRSSGDGLYSMYLDQVVSGVGTVNQVTKRFGQFAGFGRSPVYGTYDWAPLTDNGRVAPALVTLTGQTTLRVTTTGNCNPNYFMLVPTSGIQVNAAPSAGNTVLTFPTQPGVNYSVFYRTNLTAGNWTLLTSVLGTGGVKSVTDPATNSSRFYKVTAP